MGDTGRLRRHLAMLACLPALALSCDGSQAKAGGAADEQARSDASDQEAARERAPTRTAQQAKKRRGPIINEAPAPTTPKDPKKARFEPIEGDPPYIDGYNPEEGPCPSGNWCGTIETAMAVAPNPDAIAKEMDCPTRIVGSHNPSPIEGPAYAGLSAETAMQGSLNQHGTELARADGDEEACCYHWFEYCSGRPLLDDGTPRLATARPDPAWGGAAGSAQTLAVEVRRELAEQWLQDALAEHASVASFARVTLELLAIGAPPELVESAQQAGLDEIHHARRCFALAGRFGTEPCGPGPLAPPMPRTPDLATLAVDTFVEGCIGETIAALIAERSLAHASDPQVRETLEIIARDEARHAALAWRTIAWALRQGGQQGGSDVADALRQAALDNRPSGTKPEQGQDERLLAFGRLDPAARHRAATDAYRDIIEPMLASLLA